jgi:hypothetical protein
MGAMRLSREAGRVSKGRTFKADGAVEHSAAGGATPDRIEVKRRLR